MKKTDWWMPDSPEVIWLKKHIKGRYMKDLAEEMTKVFGYPIEAKRVRQYAYAHKLKSGISEQLLTREQYQWLKNHCEGLGYEAQQKQIEEKFGVRLSIAKIKGLRAWYKMNSGLTGRFEKGLIPWNKGTHYCAPGVERTQFKKGDIPATSKPVGYESVDQDGYVHIKVPGKRKMVYKHHYVWEKAHGPLPKGHCIVFLDGDKTNCTLDNLQCIDRGTHARACQRHLYTKDPELTKLGIATAKVLAARYKRRKYKQHKESQLYWRKSRQERK